MATEATLVEIIDGGRMLLKRATRGISRGMWNGLGGKIESGESPEQSAIRESFEESGLRVSNLFYHGVINFHNNGKEEVDFAVHLFSTKDFEGSLAESDEGELRWFPVDMLPLREMWKDDEIWIPLLLNSERFDADFYFDENNKNILKYDIKKK